MKLLFKRLTTLILISFSALAFSQNNTYPWPQSGDIGIKTNSPNAPLDVNGKIMAERINLKNNQLPDGTIFSSTTEKNDRSALIAAGTDSDNTNLFTIFDFPQSNYSAKSEVWLNLDDRQNSTRMRMRAETGGVTQFRLYNRFQSQIFNVEEEGNLVQFSLPQEDSYLMIGTSEYIDTDTNETYHLSVNGKVRANSVKVYTDWADFVFEKDYNLKPLSEVAAFIEKHNHLENIPSAKEVEKYGVELGEMNKLLLQKIEELTLYLIEKDIQINELSREINNIKKSH